MEPKVGAIHTSANEEFEPYCTWNRQKDADTLIVHLPEFKKEHLGVMMNNNGVLKIHGERPIDANKKSRFYKEITVSADCNSTGIQAKLVHDRLCIIMPKKTHSETQQQQPKADHDHLQDQTLEKQKIDHGDGDQSKKTHSETQQQPPKADHDHLQDQAQEKQKKYHEDGDQSKKTHSETQQQQPKADRDHLQDQAQEKQKNYREEGDQSKKIHSETQQQQAKADHDHLQDQAEEKQKNYHEDGDQSKKIHFETQQQQPKADHDLQNQAQIKQDQSKNKVALTEKEMTKEKPTSSSLTGTDSEFQTRGRLVLRLKEFGKVALMVFGIWALCTSAMYLSIGQYLLKNTN